MHSVESVESVNELVLVLIYTFYRPTSEPQIVKGWLGWLRHIPGSVGYTL